MMEGRVKKKKWIILKCREENKSSGRLKGFDKKQKMGKVERLRGD
jgi:hypothetical protein